MPQPEFPANPKEGDLFNASPDQRTDPTHIFDRGEWRRCIVGQGSTVRWLEKADGTRVLQASYLACADDYRGETRSLGYRDVPVVKE
jgi:hypothetical protein